MELGRPSIAGWRFTMELETKLVAEAATAGMHPRHYGGSVLE